MITFVVAASRNNVIGKDNQLLWRLPNDMRYFKNVTWGMPVVMGRKTFESLGKALVGRRNIVLTRNAQWEAPDVATVPDFAKALELVREMEVKEVMVIGGGEIFNMLLPQAGRIHLTRVHASFEGDAFFPELDDKEWELVSNVDHPVDDKHAYSYSFQVWERAKS